MTTVKETSLLKYAVVYKNCLEIVIRYHKVRYELEM